MSERMLLPTTVVDSVPSAGIQRGVDRGSFGYSHSTHVHATHPRPEPWLSKWLSKDGPDRR